MRIVAGTARGRRLVTLEGSSTRPTGDRVREAMFSILGNLDGAIVVDAFAGSGSLGCEALSRGAAFCYFFDNSRSAIEIVRENVKTVSGERRSEIRKCTFEFGLTNHIRHEPDLWLIDPPYQSNLASKALISMAQSRHVTEGALVVLETSSQATPLSADGFVLEDDRRYGTTRLLFYRRTADELSEEEIEDSDPVEYNACNPDSDA